MVHKCIVPGCPNQSNRKVDANGKCLKFHRLPFKNQKLLQVWLDLMGRTLTEITVSSRICSAHFSKYGLRKSGSKVPDIFPWSIPHFSSSLSPTTSSTASTNSSPSHSPQPLQSTSTPPETHVPCAACIVFRDHSYSKHIHTHSLLPSHSTFFRCWIICFTGTPISPTHNTKYEYSNKHFFLFLYRALCG